MTGGRWPERLRPRVVVWLEGVRPERALTRALAGAVQVESVRALSPDRLEVVVGAPMLRPLRRAVRGRARVRVKSRYGGPYLARSLLIRPGLWLGALMFAVVLGAAGSMVWAVRVVGVAAPVGKRIAAAAAAAGVRPGAWRKAVDRDRVAAAVASAVPTLSWAGVISDGGLVVIRAVPRVRPRAGEAAGRLLVASRSGRVVAVHVRQGEPNVRVGDEVRAGQVLVQGYLAEGGTLADGSPAPPRFVAARAVVVARWSGTASASASRVRALRTRRSTGWSWMLSVHGHTLASRAAPPGRVAGRTVYARWRIRLWGIEWMALRVERVVAVRHSVRRLTRRAATAIALGWAERRLERSLGGEARVVQRRTRVVWHGERVTATIEVEAEGDVARAEAPLRTGED